MEARSNPALSCEERQSGGSSANSVGAVDQMLFRGLSLLSLEADLHARVPARRLVSLDQGFRNGAGSVNGGMGFVKRIPTRNKIRCSPPTERGPEDRGSTGAGRALGPPLRRRRGKARGGRAQVLAGGAVTGPK